MNLLDLKFVFLIGLYYEDFVEVVSVEVALCVEVGLGCQSGSWWVGILLWLGCVLSWWLVIWIGSLMVDSYGWFGCGWLLIVSQLCIPGNGWFGFWFGLWWVTCLLCEWLGLWWVTPSFLTDLLWVAWPVVSNSIIPGWPFCVSSTDNNLVSDLYFWLRQVWFWSLKFKIFSFNFYSPNEYWSSKK